MMPVQQIGDMHEHMACAVQTVMPVKHHKQYNPKL